MTFTLSDSEFWQFAQFISLTLINYRQLHISHSMFCTKCRVKFLSFFLATESYVSDSSVSILKIQETAEGAFHCQVFSGSCLSTHSSSPTWDNRMSFTFWHPLNWISFVEYPPLFVIVPAVLLQFDIPLRKDNQNHLWVVK